MLKKINEIMTWLFTPIMEVDLLYSLYGMYPMM